MKKHFLLLFILLVWLVPEATGQIYRHTQYWRYPQAMNPAFSGIDTDWQVQTGFRRQWAGVAVAPKTISVGINGAIFQGDKFFSKRHTMRTSYSREAQQSRSNHKQYHQRQGVGLALHHTTEGFFTEFVGKASYAYHLPLARRLMATVGVSGGISSYSIDADALQARDMENDLLYLTLITVGRNRTFADLTLGTAVYGEQFYVGYTMEQLLHEPLDSDPTTETTVSYTGHYLQAGYRVQVSPVWEILGSGYLAFQEFTDTQYALNARGLWQEKFYAGLGYQSEQIMSFLAGFVYSEQYHLSYSYDARIANTEQLNGGNHEVVLSIALEGKRDQREIIW